MAAKKETYKTRLLTSLKKDAVITTKAVKDFLNVKLSDAKRLKAFEICGSFLKSADVKKAQEIYRDQLQSPAVRQSAILGLVNAVGTDEKMIDEMIGLLVTYDEPTEVRAAALTILQAVTFGSRIMAAKNDEFTNALRGVAQNDKPGGLRERAIELLALKKDPVVQDMLTEGLKDPSKELVKPEVAIQLLSYDLKASDFQLLRDIVKNPPNARAKKEAIRNLANDSGSVNLLIETLNDKKEDKETRHASAVGLRALDPEALKANIKSLITDDKEDAELRVALLNTLNYTEDTNSLDDDKDFQSKIDKFQKSKSTKLKKVAAKYKHNKFKK